MSLGENLWRADVSRIELREPVTLQPHASLSNVLETMCSHAVGCILLSDSGRLVGIFTERDVMKRVLAARADLNRPVGEFMTSPVTTIQPTDSIGSAIRTMYRGGYRRLPVVDARGTPLGIVSVKRLIRYLADHLSSTVYNLPPTTRVLQAREGA